MNNKYLPVIFGLMFFSSATVMSADSSMSDRYQNDNNVIWVFSGVPVNASMINSAMLNNLRPLPQMSPVDDVLKAAALPVLQQSSYIQPSVENRYIRRNDLSFADNVFAQILNADSDSAMAPRLSVSDLVNPDCQSPDPSVLGGRNDENVDHIQDSIEYMSAKTQYCRYEFDSRTPVETSINFCGCVRERTEQFGDKEGVVYSVMKDDDKFKEAAKVFKQKFSDLVIKDIFNELTEMTEQANAFLATEELGQILYGKIEDEATNMSLDFAQTRQRMHACSGIAMRDLVSDMFYPNSYGETLCDGQTADILLNSIKNYNSCGAESEFQCDDLAVFANHQTYRNQPADKVISDLMTFHFSKNLIRGEDLFEQVSPDANAFDKFRGALNLVSSISDTDAQNRTILIKERINTRNMLPREEELVTISVLFEQVENGRDVDLSVLTEAQVNRLFRTLTTNPLYKEVGREEGSPRLTKQQMISKFVEGLHQDKQLRISQDPNFQRFFQNEDPVEAAKILVINNYLERSEDLGLRCEAVKDKVRTLCSSMNGNGVALFSHPDFREQAETFIVDENLHKEMNRITDTQRERSPVVDQLFCHANYASISNDCQETLRVRYNASANFGQCAYQSDWLLKHLDRELAIGVAGNVEASNIMTIDRIRQTRPENGSDSSPISSSGRAFASILNSDENGPQVYGIAGSAGNSRSVASTQQPSTSEESVVPAVNSVIQNQVMAPVMNNDSFQMNTNGQNSFSDQFSQSNFVPVVKNTALNAIQPQQAAKNEAVVESNSATDLLLNELRASEKQQKRYLEELDALKKKKDTALTQKEKNELKEKQREIAALDDRVKNLRSEVHQKQQEVRSSESRVSSSGGTSISRPSQFAPTPTPSATSSANFGASSGGASYSSTGAGSVSSGSAAGTAGAKTASFAAQGLSLSAQSSQLVPFEASLSLAVRGLSGRDYILRDVGIPGKAEKIIFQTRDGEVIIVDGEPQILSVELIDLIPEALAEAEAETEADNALHEVEIQARAPASNEGRREAYWDEVLDLIKNSVTK